MWTDARTLCRELQTGALTSEAVLAEVYRRIEAVNPQVNALVSLLDKDEALALARAADQVPIADRGPLHGLPMATKDAVEVEGFATTWGFVPWAENFAAADDTFAARMRAAGAFFIGRSNMPEFGLGSNTFNDLYGRTKNPYDLSRTPGGSSGGAAVALATQMLPLADGSDMGGSLRNPASFCNVVGFRPSIGRMPHTRGYSWLGRLGTTGPMARTVADTAFFMSVLAGPDPHDPLTLPEPGEFFLDALVPLDNLDGVRIAYAPTLHGIPVEAAVLEVMERAAATLTDLGADVVPAVPPLQDAMAVFQSQRASGLAATAKALDRAIPDWRQHAKETAVWNMEKGLAQPAADILDAEFRRSKIYAATADFFNDFDLIILPAAQVLPFPSDQEWIEMIEGVPMETYIDWMTVCCAVTATGCPAISVPGGFSGNLPVGLQMVGPPRDDLSVLRIAHTFEAATNYYEQKPQVSAV